MKFILSLFLLGIIHLSCSDKQEDGPKSFVIIALDGIKYSINVTTDYVNQTMRVSIDQKESVCFYGVTNIQDSVKVEQGKFLAINVAIRGGTGVKLEKTIKMCIVNGKLKQVFNIYSYQYSEILSSEDVAIGGQKKYATLKNVETAFDTNNTFIFKETITDSDTMGNNQPKEILNSSRLNFDKKNGLCYNEFDTLNGSYNIVNYLSEKRYRHFQSEIVPVIKLKTDKYYYINDVWCQLESGTFFELSGKCQ